MDRRHRFYWTGLLILLIPLFFPIPLSGQSGEETGGELAVLVESSPERPVLGGSWRVSILVDHPAPEEVRVIPPDMPSSLTFAQSRKEIRIIRTSPGKGTPWTLVEFLFVPQGKGVINLGAFEVITPGGSARTINLRTYVTAQEGVREEYHPRLAWDTPPATLRIEEKAELTLRILDWDPRRELKTAPFHTTAPAEALLEELPLTKEDLDQNRVLRLRLTPLGGNQVSLGPFPLRFDTLTLEAPAIAIRLLPPVSGKALPVTASETLPPMAGTRTNPPQEVPPPAFPEPREEPFSLFRTAYEETLNRAREFWSRALYAEALGELRRGERDLLGGPNLASIRRAAEQALGLSVTEDEKWRPRNFFWALIILSFFLLILALGLLKKGVTSPFFRSYRIVLLLLVVILGLGIAGLASSPGTIRSEGTIRSDGTIRGEQVLSAKLPGETKYSGGTAAVLRACVAYRIPDSQGAISARWMEGQPVKVRTASNLWAYAESSDGDAGWVRQDRLIFY
ncbi:MAG: hypothetical protein LBR99_00895 [Treponema sp.]|nr:hypothetical protein [Treponema sp.]